MKLSRTGSLLVLSLGLGVAGLSAEDRRTPVPAEAVQKMREKLVRDLLKADYARSSNLGRRALATKLLEQASKERDPVTRYVLLRDAHEFSVDAGDYDVAKKAEKEIIERYQVKETALRDRTLARIAVPPKDTILLWKVLRANLDLLEDAFAANEFAVADEAGGRAVSIARKTRETWLYEVAKDSRAEVKKVQREYDRFHEAVAVLFTQPDDAEANLTVGRYLCFFKGRWESGFSYLLKGSDETLRSLARRDMDRPDDPLDRLKLGEAWLAQAKELKEPARDYAQARALYWFESATPGLSGLSERPRAQAGLEEIARQARLHLPGAKKNHGLWFDGESDYVRIRGLRYDGSHPLTAEAIVRPEPFRELWRVIVGNCASTPGFALGIRGRHWAMWFHAGGRFMKALSAKPVEMNRRVHVAGVFDGKSLRLYIDGKLQGKPTPVTKSHDVSPHDLFVGADPATGGETVRQSFRGAIGEVRVSRSARYTKSFTPGPVLVADIDTLLLLHLDEGVGGEVRDVSSGGRSGEIHGATWIKFR